MFNIFKGKPKNFITNKQHNENLASQLSMSPKTVEQLNKHGIDENKLLKLEYFFYTNNAEKADKLSKELEAMGYSSEFGVLEDNKEIQLITGWTTPISISTNIVVEWTKQMCDIGFKHDCEFDGWGTNPEQ